MFLKEKLRRKLELRFNDVAMMVTAGFLALAMVPGIPWRYAVANLIVLGAFAINRIMVLRRLPGSTFVLLGLSLATLTSFDDGFGGKSMLWLVHIPVALASWILVPSVKGRTLWILAQILSVALVNHTPFTPRLAEAGDGFLTDWQGHINLVMSTAVSLLIVRFLHQLQLAALAAARAQKLQAESASRAKDEFLSHMSHELRTPLNSIQGFSDLSLQSTGLSPELEENLRSIRQSAEHLTHLVNDLLDLARLENGTVVLAREGFSPGRCIEESIALLRPQAREKQLDLTWTLPEDLPRVRGDRVRWKQILLNLIGNAIKYTPSGSVHVAAAWNEEAPNRGILRVAVTDTGIGIAPEDQPKVFDRFHRLGGFAAPSGTGLGLPITAILAKAMGGRIDLRSEIGRGSTFTVTLPFDVAEKDAASQTSLSLSAPLKLSGRRVLLAEDNRINIRLATQVLRQLNVDFDVAEDGGKAMELLRANHYDVLLLDLHMPVMNGFEVARAIRDPGNGLACSDIPILALTADAFEETRQKTRDAGMDDFLTKPFRIPDLADRIVRLVSERPRRNAQPAN